MMMTFVVSIGLISVAYKAQFIKTLDAIVILPLETLFFKGPKVRVVLLFIFFVSTKTMMFHPLPFYRI